VLGDDLSDEKARVHVEGLLQGSEEGCLNIKVTKLDRLFSKLVRSLAGWKCERCGKQYHEGSRGLHNSHYLGRRAMITRFDLENCDSLCHGCHSYFHQYGLKYVQWKIEKLGEERHRQLEYRFDNVYQKKTKAFMEETRQGIEEMLDAVERI